MCEPTPKMMKVLVNEGIAFHQCPCFSITEDSTDDYVIPTYYSYKHAIDMGWIKTNSPQFCDPKWSFCWVCPECTKKVFKNNHIIHIKG